MPQLIALWATNLAPKIAAIAQRRRVTLTLIGTLAFVGSATLGLIGGIAKPGKHDEFSYLLAADTFARGRLTNPTHPMWVHFENIHIIHIPTHMSKYPPGQGAILALGQVLTGYPIVGVWLSMGLMCSAICWMLQAWVPARWALIGGFFAIIHPIMGIGGGWAQSYWGGALAATGGALVLGGIRNLLKEPQVPQALLTGLGLAILANSRPYEGMLLSICAAWMLFLRFCWQRKFNASLHIRKIVLPLAFTCSLTAAWMGYYNYRVTGSIFTLPYQIHEQMYGSAPLFVLQNPNSQPEYRHAHIRDFHRLYALSFYDEKHSWTGFIKVNLNALLYYFLLIANVFAVPLLASTRAFVRWSLHSPWARRALATYALVTIGIMLETFTLVHYWAPVIALNYYFTLQAIRLWRRRDPRISPLICPAMIFLASIVLIFVFIRRIQEENNPLSAQVQRVNLLAHLEQQSGKHVVLVNYGPKQSDYHFAWVYNEADIDRAKVVWAQDMGKIENCKLVDYFKDHLIWSLEIERDDAPVRLKPFTENSCR